MTPSLCPQSRPTLRCVATPAGVVHATPEGGFHREREAVPAEAIGERLGEGPVGLHATRSRAAGDTGEQCDPPERHYLSTAPWASIALRWASVRPLRPVMFRRS